MPKRSTRIAILLVVVGVLSLPVILVALFWSGAISFEPSIGSAAIAGESPISGLPNDAKDVHWYRPGLFGPIFYYDFATTEESFIKWVANIETPRLSGPTEGRVEILMRSDEESYFIRREIEHAISHSWRNEGDGWLNVTYDKDTHRAYFLLATR